MKKRITTLLLALVLVVSLFAAVGCSSDTSTDSSSMTDAEREQYIQEKMVGSGKVLTESELLDNGYELSTDGETENMIKLLSTGNYSLYVDFQNADFILVDEGAGTKRRTIRAEATFCNSKLMTTQTRSITSQRPRPVLKTGPHSR